MFTKDKIRSLVFSLMMLAIFTLGFSGAANAQTPKVDSKNKELVSQGKALFKANCKSCHRVGEDLTGPALTGVYKRRSFEWVANFVRNPQAAIDGGDKVAVELFNKFGSVMASQAWMTDQDVAAVLSAIKADDEGDPIIPVVQGGLTESAAGGSAGIPGYVTFLIYFMAGVLALALVGLAGMASALRRRLDGRDDISEDDAAHLANTTSIWKILKSGTVTGLATFFFVAYILKVLFDASFTIGVQQGYAPEQPIPFSHKLHAGEYEIDCRYCHTGVEKSKNANIPSPNICMGCHNQIRTTSEHIQKIYEAVETGQAIQWVRVHNLPDLSYFNHKQHVKVGGIECETCHGDVKNMEVIQQHSILTMGWCIACHRKTKVNAKGNDYYDRLLKLHDEKTKGNRDMTVEDIGGMECSKCHY